MTLFLWMNYVSLRSDTWVTDHMTETRHWHIYDAFSIHTSRDQFCHLATVLILITSEHYFTSVLWKHPLRANTSQQFYRPRDEFITTVTKEENCDFLSSVEHKRRILKNCADRSFPCDYSEDFKISKWRQNHHKSDLFDITYKCKSFTGNRSW